MSDLSPFGPAPVLDLTKVDGSAYRQKLRQRTQGIRHSLQRRQSLSSTLFDQARHSTDRYTVDLAEVAQNANAAYGIDSRDFFSRPDWYQALIENPAPEPDRDGFLKRLATRTRDGTVLAQMGRLGSDVMYGFRDREKGMEEIDRLRSSLSDFSWLEQAKGVGPWIEKQLGTVLQSGAMQADILATEAGVAALAGVALGAPGGPAGTLLGGKIGLRIGLGAGNVRMMQGLEYLDLLQQEIEMPDGTKVPMPEQTAKSVAEVVGLVNGAIEFLQWSMVGPLGVRALAGVRKITSQTLRRMMVEGTIRQATTRAIIQGGALAATENVQEITQEVASTVAAEIATSIAESDLGGVRVGGVPLGEAIHKSIMDTLKVSVGIGLMALPGTFGSLYSGLRARGNVAAKPETLFNRTAPYETTPMAGVPVAQITPRQRLLAEETVRVAQSAHHLSPITVERTASGLTIPNTDQQAIVEVLRRYGVQSVPTLALPAPGETSDVTGGGAAAQPGAAAVAGEEPTVRDPVAFDELRQQLRELAPEGISDEQVTAAAINAELFTSSANLTLREWMERRFPDGVAAAPDVAQQLLMGTYRRQQEPAAAAAEAGKGPTTTPAPPTGAGAVPRGLETPTTRAALPPPPAEPVWSVVDPVRLAPPDEDNTPARTGSAIVAWEPANGGPLQVVGGGGRAAAVRGLRGDGAPFETPMRVLRESDGVSLEDALRRGPELADQAGTTTVNIAAALRDQPIERKLKDRPLPEWRTREVLGLVELDDQVFEMVRNGDVAPEHAAWIGALIPDDPAMQRRLAESFMATPPVTVYEAEVRVRRRAVSPEGITAARILDVARTGAAGDLFELAQQIAQRGRPLHAGAVREHLSRLEIYGRALYWWTSGENAMASDLSALLEDLVEAGPDSIQQSVDGLLGELRGRLAALYGGESIRMGAAPHLWSPRQAAAAAAAPTPAAEPAPVTPEPSPAQPERTYTAADGREVVQRRQPDGKAAILARERGRKGKVTEYGVRLPADVASGLQPGDVVHVTTRTDREWWTRFDSIGIEEGRTSVIKTDGSRIDQDPTAELPGVAPAPAAAPPPPPTPPAAVDEEAASMARFSDEYRAGEQETAKPPAAAPTPTAAPPTPAPTPTPEIKPAPEAKDTGLPPQPQPQRVLEDAVLDDLADALEELEDSGETTLFQKRAATAEMVGAQPTDRFYVVEPELAEQLSARQREELDSVMNTFQEMFGSRFAKRIMLGLETERGYLGSAFGSSRIDIWPNAPAGLRRILAHELGHLLQSVEWEGLFTDWTGPQHATSVRELRTFLTADGQSLLDTAAPQLNIYARLVAGKAYDTPLKQFQEWYADQLAAYMRDAERVVASATDGFFKRLATALREFFHTVVIGDTLALARDFASYAGRLASAMKSEPEPRAPPRPSVRRGPNILFQDRPATAEAKRQRIVLELLKRLMWGERLHTFQPFADRFQQVWGDRRHADVMRGRLRDWYEMARRAAPPWVGEMSTPEEITAWYEEASDVRGRGAEGAPGTEPGGVPPVGAERGAEGVRPEPRPAGEADVPGDRGEEPAAATARAGEGDSDRRHVRRDPDAGKRGAGERVGVETNWAFGPGELTETETRGAAAKARDNVTAIETMQAVRAESRPATPDEQAAMAQYVGWGGLSGAFPDTRGRFAKGMKPIGERLRELLTDAEYEAARRSIQYAHYTSETVIEGMWAIARGLGFNGGNVLDPGSGIGHFAGLMPMDIAGRAAYLGIELDPVTAGIARLLYPHWSMRTSDLSKVRLAPDTFALAIGNPPFGNITVSDDQRYARYKFLLHDYFFAKSIDTIKPDGLMVFISSAGTMNKRDAKARQYIADRADFMGGIRLPNIAFKRNAGTEVTTDVLVFRKRREGAPVNDVAPWTDTVLRQMVDRDGNQVEGRISEYFAEHPDQVLGEGGMFDELTAGVRYGVRPSPGMDADNLAEHLSAAVERLVAAAPRKPVTGNIELEPQTPDTDLDVEGELPETKEGSYHLTADGKLLQRRNDRMQEPLRKGGSGKYVNLSKNELARVRRLVPVRDAYRSVLAADVAGDVEAGNAARVELAAVYDAFVAEFGPITSMTVSERKPTRIDQETARRKAREEAQIEGEPWEEGTFSDAELLGQEKPAGVIQVAQARQQARELAARRGRPFDEGSFDPNAMPLKVQEKFTNLYAFLADSESYRLLSLEDGYDMDTNTATKGKVFTEPIVHPPREANIETAEDAMLHVIGATGGFDADAAAAAWGRSTSELVEDLGELVFYDPKASSWMLAEEYLSGDVVERLVLAEQEVQRDPSLTRNVEALRSVQPPPVPQSKIEVDLGGPWIPKEVIGQFAEEVMLLTAVQVAHNEKIGQWLIESDSPRTAQDSNQLYGVNRGVEHLRTSTQVLRAAVNQRPLKAPRVWDGESMVADKEGDRLAQEAVDKLRAAFRDWLWKDQARSDELVLIYNDRYNREVPRQYRSDYIKTPGVRADWKWNPHQKRGIARILLAGNTYLNHAVGSGKTSTMIAAAMELRRLGLAYRPVFAVPNHVLAHFASEWYHLYPEARILVADEWHFHKDRRQRFIADAGSGDYDGIIMSHDSFKLIQMSSDFSQGLIAEQIAEFEAAISAIGKDGDRFTRKQLESAKEKLQRKFEALAATKKDEVLTFEELGADVMFIDEAHEYRNLAYATVQRLKGLNPEGNQKSFATYAKTRYLDQMNPGRGVVYASGTPITNSLAEIWTLQRYLDDSGLREYGLESFDSWAGTFGAVESDLEPDVAGGYRYVDRFSRLKNQYQLFKLMMRFMDVVTPSQLREMVTVPELKGGEREQVYVESTPSQDEFFEEIKARSLAMKSSYVDPKIDNPLKLTTEGRQAAMDMRLLPGYANVREQTKVELMIDNVFEIWEQTKDHPFHEITDDGYGDVAFRGPATQIIFSPFGFKSGTERLFLPSYLKLRLASLGVPEAEVAFIGDHDTLAKKRQLFRDMNAGKVRVLIGSEMSMGTGVNVQQRLYALHALGPLWNPARDEQRVGRILRQGNLNPTTRVLDYSTIGSFDTAMWDLMKRKARGIEQFYRGDPDMEFVEDVSQQDMYRVAAAMTTYDPRAMRLAELQKTVEQMSREIGAASRDKANAESAAVSARRRAVEHAAAVASMQADIERREDTTGDRFTITVEGQTYSKRPDATTALQRLDELVVKTRVLRTTKGKWAAAEWDAQIQEWKPIGDETFTAHERAETVANRNERRILTAEEREIGRFAGFNLRLVSVPRASGAVVLIRPGADRAVTAVMLAQPGSILAKLERALRNLDQRFTETESEIETLGVQAERMDAEAAKPLPSARELDTLTIEMRALERQLSAEATAAEATAAHPPDDGAPEELIVDETDVLTQLRAPGGEQAQSLTQELVERYGMTENPQEAGYVLWDGRMLRRPPAEPEGGPNPATLMAQTDAVRTDGRMIHAEGPVSNDQIGTLLQHADDRAYSLMLTHHGRRMAATLTKHPLNADTLQSFFARNPSPSAARGATKFDEAGQAVIALAEDADFDTLMEELFHVFRRDLPADQEAVIGKWAGATQDPDGKWVWDRDAEERFARGGIEFLRDEATDPPDGVRTVFERVSQWLRDLYAGIRLMLTPDVRKAYEDLLFARGQPEVLAYERLSSAMEGQERGEFSDGTDRLVVQRVGPGWVADRLDDEDNREARREHPTLTAALQDVAGLPTIETPVPIGNARYRELSSDNDPREPMETNAQLAFATDEMTLGDFQEVEATEPSGSEVRVVPGELLTDPARFQYKGDVDPQSIRARWAGVTAWSPLFSNSLVIWQDRAGQQWVVDGHQRVELARMLSEQGRPVPETTAIIYNEHDTTVAEVRRYAALKNMVEGSGSEVDAAKVLRELDPADFDQAVQEMGASNRVVEQAQGLAKLSDETFEIVARGVLPPRFAAVIGDRVADPKSQLALIRAMVDEKPESADEARALVSEWLLGQQEGNVQQTLMGLEMLADSVWRERARVLSRSLSTLRKRKRIFSAVSRKAEAEWLASAGNMLLGVENVARMDQAAVMADVIERLARQQGPVSDALTAAAEVARDAGKLTKDTVERFLTDVEQLIAQGAIAVPGAEASGEVREAGEQITLLQLGGDQQERGRREARTADVRTTARAAGAAAPQIPAGGLGAGEAARRLRTNVRGARTREQADARRHAIDTILRLAHAEGGEATPARPTRGDVGEAARAGLQETATRARADEARRAQHIENIRYGRQRISEIQRQLRAVLRGSRTLPEPLRSSIRFLAEDLNLRRRGRVDEARMDPAAAGGRTDPLRLLAVLDAVLEGEVPPGADMHMTDKPLSEMHLVELERMNRRVQAAVHHVRELQREGTENRRESTARVVAAVTGELEAAPRALNTKLPQPVRSAVELLGLSSERPEFFLERVAGLQSHTYDAIWRKVKGGVQTAKTVGKSVAQQYGEDLRRVGITMTGPELEVWLNEWITAPALARDIRERFTRAELMSFALLWNDPYARRMLTDAEGGMVVSDNPLIARPSEVDATKHVITDQQAEALIAMLGDQERRIIFGDQSPVRRFFDRMYVDLNTAFRAIHGYDLEKWPGYFPIHIAQGAIPPDAEIGSSLGHFMYAGQEGATPYQGFLQFRQRATLPISLRPLSTEINSALRHSSAYIGLEAPLRTVRAILASPRVKQALRRQGASAPGYINRYVQSVAGRYMGDDGLLDAANMIRRNVTVATLASPTVALNQALSLALAKNYVPARFIAKAIAQATVPSEARLIRQRHIAMDPDFAERLQRGFDPDAMQRGLAQALLPHSRSVPTKWQQRILDGLMKPISMVDQWTVTRVEHAAVLHAMDALSSGGKPSRQMAGVLRLHDPQQVALAQSADSRLKLAYEWGQYVVSRTQPSHLAENLSDMQRRPVARLFTSFSGYTNVAMNELRAALRNVRRHGLGDTEAVTHAVSGIVSILVIGTLGTALIHRLRDWLYGRDEEEPIVPYLAREAAFGAGGLVYVVRDLQYLLRGFDGGFEPVVLEALVDVLREFDRTFRAIRAGRDAGPAVTRLLGAGARLAGLPFWTLHHYAQGAARWLDDD